MGARQSLGTAAVVSLLLSSAAAAHHSFVVVYDTERSQQVAGSITGFLFRNPHTLRLQRVQRPADGWSWQGVTK